MSSAVATVLNARRRPEAATGFDAPAQSPASQDLRKTIGEERALNRKPLALRLELESRMESMLAHAGGFVVCFTLVAFCIMQYQPIHAIYEINSNLRLAFQWSTVRLRCAPMAVKFESRSQASQARFVSHRRAMFAPLTRFGVTSKYSWPRHTQCPMQS